MNSPSERRTGAELLPENRVVSGLWIGVLSPLERMCLSSFVRQGHEFHLYSYDPLPDLPAGVVLRDAAEILPREQVMRNQQGAGKGSFACFSDLFRYKLLLDRGGWWIDTDVFCLRPFNFAAPYVFGAEDKPVATGIIKAPRGSQLIRRCYEQACRVDLGKVVWNELVDIFASEVRGQGLMNYVQTSGVFSPIAWHAATDYVLGKRRYVPSAESYGVHLYNEMWRRNHLDKFGVYPRGSVIEILKQHAGFEGELFGADPRRTVSRGWLRRWLPRWAA